MSSENLDSDTQVDYEDEKQVGWLALALLLLPRCLLVNSALAC